jgi:hypothetical protein
VLPSTCEVKRVFHFQNECAQPVIHEITSIAEYRRQRICRDEFSAANAGSISRLKLRSVLSVSNPDDYGPKDA